MAREVEFFFDYGSPFSYLADSQLKGLAERTGARVIYRPMLLGGVFKETGNSSPITIEAKRKYSNIDLERWAKHYGVSALHNAYFPINTIRLMRGAIAAERLGVFPAYHRAIYDAFWGDGLNLGDAPVVREVLGAGARGPRRRANRGGVRGACGQGCAPRVDRNGGRPRRVRRADVLRR